MPILSNPFDSPEAVRLRESQPAGEASAMYLVVRREKVGTLSELAVALAGAVLDCAQRLGEDPRYVGDFAAWYADSFRKITLRANERDWPKLLAGELALSLGGMSEPIVAVLPPRRKSAASPLVRSLQTYALTTAELPIGELSPDLSRPALVLCANPEISMSAGKLLAQIGHGALMAARAPEELGAGQDWRDALAAWRASGEQVIYTTASATGWRSTIELESCVAVVDSGLTEIAPGSQTVLAIRPSAGEALRTALARLAS
jgi:peptidyl-tRNA hydrolase